MKPRAKGTEMETGVYNAELCVDEKGRELNDNDIIEKKHAQYIADRLPAHPKEASATYRSNGTRLYRDTGGQAEGVTPECRDIVDLLVYERAVEQQLADLFPEAAVFKHNLTRNYESDTGLATLGYHENYQILNTQWMRASSRETLAKRLAPHFISRIIYTGAGSTMYDAYTLTQRAPFLQKVFGERRANRGVFYLKPQRSDDAGRLHVTAGDANVNEIATALKLGITSMALDAVEDEWKINSQPKKILEALTIFNEDPLLAETVETTSGKKYRALDFQWELLENLHSYYESHPKYRDAETNWLLAELEDVLTDLEKDPLLTTDRLDWPLKQWGVESMMWEDGLEWNDPVLIAFDHEYHAMTENSIRQEAERLDQMQRITDADRVEKAQHHPPTNTRAYCRGLLIDRLGSALTRVRWNEMVWKNTQGKKEPLLLKNPLHTYEESIETDP